MRAPDHQALLRIAFAAGAITDALAVVPMLVPWFARLLWGIEDGSSAYIFAMRYAAALMLGWTGLLIWAYQRPLDRRGVAALTVLVIIGLIAAEIAATLSGHMQLRHVAPTLMLQAMLLLLFASPLMVRARSSRNLD